MPLRSNMPTRKTLASPYCANRHSMDLGRNSCIRGKNRKDTGPDGNVSFTNEHMHKILDLLAGSGCHFKVDRRMLLILQTK
ncbi:hypothetical protein SK128_018332, partial [Halocaridina rubra]